MGLKGKTRASEKAATTSLDEMTLRSMMRSTRFIRQIMEPFFEGIDISLSQWVLMRVMLNKENETNEPVRLVDLSNMLMIRQPTLTSAINKLVLMGFVERDHAENDRRGRQVRLSARGRAMIDQTIEPHSRMIQKLFNVWNNQEKELVCRLFESLENHLRHHIHPDGKHAPVSLSGTIRSTGGIS
jgi:DNA-binding MarR family transcriptional regulator